MDWVVTRIQISKLHPGWTLEYIDGLSEDNVIQMFAHEEGVERWKKRNKKKR